MINRDDILFKHPFCMTVAGPSQSGKTRFVTNMILKSRDIIKPSPTKIVYCYSVWQQIYQKLLDSVDIIEFHEGLPSLNNIDSKDNNLYIFDDLMDECGENKQILNLFTVGSHHKNCSVIFITQNIYLKGKYTRSMNLNSHYIVLFNNLQDKSQIYHLARQLYPQKQKFFQEVFDNSVCKTKYGHLLIDLKQDTPEELRLRSYDENSGDLYVYISNE